MAIHYTKISEIKALFNNSMLEIPISGIFVNTPLHIDSTYVNNKALTFENCTFNRNVTFSNIDFNYGVRFINCKFLDSLSFSNTSTSSFNQIWNTDGDSVIISECKIKSLIFHTQNKYFGSIRIVDNSEITHIKISSLELTHQNAVIQIKKSSVKDVLTIDNCKTNNSIGISESQIDGEVYITALKCNVVSFKNSKFSKNVKIFSCEISSKIYLTNCYFFDSVNLRGVKNERIYLLYSKFENDFIFKFSEFDIIQGFKHIDINSCSFLNGCRILGVNAVNNESVVNNIDIKSSKLLSGLIHFKNLIVETASLSGPNYDSHIVFENIKFYNLLFKNFSNFANLQFISVKSAISERSSLDIHNSYLGKTFFSNCDLSTFKLNSISNSDFSEIVASNVTWFNPKSLTQIDNKLVDSQQKRELFRQLKFAMEKQGNRIQALEFKQYELSAYKKELACSKGRPGDRIITFLSQSNDFGQNWVKPVLILLLIIVPIFGFLILIAYNKGFSDFNRVFCDYKRVFVNLLNPAITLKEIFGEQVFSGCVISVLAAYRVFYAYFVFQIISAFRKYIK